MTILKKGTLFVLATAVFIFLGLVNGAVQVNAQFCSTVYAPCNQPECIPENGCEIVGSDCQCWSNGCQPGPRGFLPNCETFSHTWNGIQPMACCISGPEPPPGEFACQAPYGCYDADECGTNPGEREPCSSGDPGNCDAGTAGDDSCNAAYPGTACCGEIWDCDGNFEVNPFNITDLASAGRYAINFWGLKYGIDSDCHSTYLRGGVPHDCWWDCELYGRVGLSDHAGDYSGAQCLDPDSTTCLCGDGTTRCRAGGYTYGVAGFGITRTASIGYTNAHTECNNDGACGSCDDSRTYLYACGNFKCPDPQTVFINSGYSPDGIIDFTIYTNINTDINLMPDKRLHDTTGGASNLVVYHQLTGARNTSTDGYMYGTNRLHNCVMFRTSVNKPEDGVTFRCQAPDAKGIYTATFSSKNNCDVRFIYSVGPFDPPTCNLNLPGIINISTWGTATRTLNVNPTSSDGSLFTSFDYILGNSSIAEICDNGTAPCNPGADFILGSISPVINITGINVGTTNIRVDATTATGAFCNKKAVVNVIVNPPAWWQIDQGSSASLVGTDSNISSCGSPSCEAYLITQPASNGSTVGVAVAGGGTGTIDSSNVSTLGYVVAGSDNAAVVETDFDYFYNKIPSDAFSAVTINNNIDLASMGWVDSGYRWIIYDGDTTGTDANIGSGAPINIGDNKIILFIKGANLNINDKINLTDGNGFLAVFVEGNININPVNVGSDPAVRIAPDLEGIFLAKDEFRTGTVGADSDTQLKVRGAVTAFSKPKLERSIPDNSLYPAEVFEYAPDLALNFPKSLSVAKVDWKEVAP